MNPREPAPPFRTRSASERDRAQALACASRSDQLPGPSRSVGRRAAALLALAAVIFIAHGRSLSYGLFMDDHAHFRQLRECDWSLAGLVDACRLDLVGGVIDIWWLPACTLRFFRPVAFALMKLTYKLGGWSPLLMHVANLGWHLLNCVLLMTLLSRLGTPRLLAWAAAMLFAIHPAHVGTVQWIACQSELMVTALLLAATLAYLRYRGISESAERSATAAPGSAVCGFLSALAFAAALGCRENAIALPAVLIGLEPLIRRRGGNSSRLATSLVTAALLIAAYAWLRTSTLGGGALPPRPYVYPPADPGFVRYIFDKACYYLLGEFLLVPCVPIGGLPYLRDRAGLFYGASGALLLILTIVLIRNRRQPTGWIGFSWLIGFMLPVLPAFESPHHLYLPGVGWAIVMTTLLGDVAGLRHTPHPTRWGQRFAAAGVVLLATGFSFATYFSGLALDIAQRVEDAVADEAADARGLRSGDRLYFLNLPIIAHYVRYAVEERTGLRDLHATALTWSPRVLGLRQTGIHTGLTRLSDREIEVAISGDAYLAGAFGLLVRQATGREIRVGPFGRFERYSKGQPDFRVSILDADATGVRRLRVDFTQPPAETHAHLFWTSASRWAYPIE
ncbi:hypothetical protein RAS1_39910 [Phycisphaerae bacterium RAS1]|nr:hypothetical protein RAS1_39910 [Phycisphaerae bacterium RAS1]